MYISKNKLYHCQEAVKYYQDNGYNIYENEHTLFKSYLKEYQESKTTFYPYAGEFGVGIFGYALPFHYANAKHKIACIPKGYECFFPSANQFIYDYPGPNWNTHCQKDGDLLPKPDLRYESFDFGEKKRAYHKFYKWKLDERIQFKKFIFDNIGNDVRVRNISHRRILKDPITTLPLFLFAKIPFKNPNKYGIKVDVVFSNRKHGVIKNGDYRSFLKWPETIKHLRGKGLTVGGIGKKESSFDNLEVINNFDFDSPNEAALEMLHNAKYYIGTDTGVTHLAMNFLNLKSLLFRLRDWTPNLIYPYQLTNNNVKVINEMCKNYGSFNDEKILFKCIDKFFI